MSYHLIDGKKIAAQVKLDIAARTQKFIAETGVTPGLAVVIAGENPASEIYIRNKAKGCADVGFHSEIHRLPSTATTADVVAKVEELKQNPAIHGILVQLPLPAQIDEQAIIAAVPPEKDVDAFHPVNVGHITIGNYQFLPCTPAGIMKLLAYEGISVDGKNCVIAGRSNIVGKPMALLLLQANGTVTVCHSHTKDLPSITRQADILVSAVGKAHFITADMVKEGAVVIDVGMNRDENGKLMGDVEFEEVAPKTSAITPVPGGVGAMTIVMLLENTLTAAKLQTK